ncbi:uncharacterized protein LOC135829471 [Sycon ciliatum]|uniref:uncharacterized protein LOC135829471 n=1 Tax=Sycon ciliatum TaxID=27933 RepID=UPI0031F6F59F
MAEGQSSAMAQPGASMATAAEIEPQHCLTPGKDERVTVAEPSAETASPFHSIFALAVGCGHCDKATGKSYQGTCFLLSDLNSAATKDYIIFATAAHNLVCNDCGDWLWVRIYKDLSAPPLTSEKISRKNDHGGLIVPNWYKEHATEKTNELFLHDYGIIAVKTSKVSPLVKWADKKLGVAPQCKKEEGVRMCGYPVYTCYGGIEETAKDCKYWVKEDRLATFANHDHQLHYFVDATGGQSGSPVFRLPKEDEAETASATGYVVGIHVGGGKKHNTAVKLRDERKCDTTPMADLRKWANDPSKFLPEENVAVAENVAVVCSQKSVKPGVRPSEQNGLHGGRPQLVISGPEEPKKMFYDDPFDHPDYVAKIDVPLKDLDGVELRQRLQKKGLLTKSQVKRLEKMSSETHNNELIGWIQSSRRHGYVKLCEVIQEWTVVDPELLKDMNNLLQPE